MCQAPRVGVDEPLQAWARGSGSWWVTDGVVWLDVNKNSNVDAPVEPAAEADRTAQLLARRAAVVARGVPRGTLFAVDRASGAGLIDVDGRPLLDFASGIGVMTAGHCRDEVARAVSDQVARLQHLCMHIATYEPYVALCERLVGLLPHGAATKAMLLNSGAEAVENAVKIARQATGRPAVICFTGGFHGRTLLGMSLSSKVGYKTGCGPFAPEIYRLPFPHVFGAGQTVSSADAYVDGELARLRAALVDTVAAQDVAAVLVEVVQGEGGIVPIPGRYLRGLREVCSEHGIVLIIDEVQSGLARTGRWAAYEHFGVTPDLSTWGKALGGGLPLAAVVGRAEVMDAALPGTIGGTFGGNPVACAAALATLELMEREDHCARATAIGEVVRERLLELQTRHAVVADIRGIGAMMAMELCEHGDPGRPASALAQAVLARCHAHGVLVIGAGMHGNVIRILPPVVITDEELTRGLDIICAAVTHGVEGAS
jgi:4-aminobutyrate aminotransferase/(S)-3-amino-2-methylpropionate transaminase